MDIHHSVVMPRQLLDCLRLAPRGMLCDLLRSEALGIVLGLDLELLDADELV